MHTFLSFVFFFRGPHPGLTPGSALKDHTWQLLREPYGVPKLELQPYQLYYLTGPCISILYSCGISQVKSHNKFKTSCLKPFSKFISEKSNARQSLVYILRMFTLHIKSKTLGEGCSSVVEYMLHMFEALLSIPPKKKIKIYHAKELRGRIYRKPFTLREKEKKDSKLKIRSLN